MQFITRLTLGAGLAVGYVLGSAAGHARYQQITSAANRLAHHPQVEQAVVNLTAKARTSSERLPGPAADLVNTAATRLEGKLAGPSDGSPLP